VCAEDFAAACPAMVGDFDVLVQDPAATADALSKPDGGDVLDAWVVPSPWPAIVDDNRQRAGLEPLFGADPAPVARSAIVAVGPEDLADCDWRCLGDRAGDDLTLGGRSFESGLGTLTFAAAVAGWFGSADFAANDLDGEVLPWASGLVDALEQYDDPVTRLLQSRAFFDVALSYEAEAKAALDAATPDRKAGLALLYPSPVAYLDVLVVGSAPGLVAVATDVLRARGWTAPGDGPSGLPRAGVIVALRELVR
jgi:hypothetical protein